MKEQLRFAGLVRVSTEGQKEKGASLKTQKDSIKGSVKQLGGNPANIGWYEGQEHSTEGYERKICDQLLADANKNLFDAVICYDLSRWSRDNLRSKTNLKVLEKNGIKFYEGTRKYDLSNYDDIFYIGIMTEINERAAKEIKAKACESKITRAQEGWAVSSPKCLPWGRTFDNDKKKVYASVYDRWGIKDGAKEQMNMIVDRYINREKTKVLADELGIYPSNLLEIFRGCLGKKWKRSFFSPRRNEKVPVEIPIPALIDDEKKIEKVMETIESKKTWAHGSYKNDYLFASIIFDGNCGHTLTGTIKGGIKYYYHQDNYKKGCGSRKYIPEKDLEVAVFSHLFYMYRDDEKIEEAVCRTYPDQEKQKQLRAADAFDLKEILKIDRSINTIVGAVGEGNIKPEQAKLKLKDLEERKVIFQNKIEKRKPLLQDTPPTRKEIEDEVQLVRLIAKRCYSSPSQISKMSFKDKRRLLELAFGGKDRKGDRLGIYIEQGSTKKSIKYSIKGKFSKHPRYKEEISGEFPMSRVEIQELLKIETDYEGDYSPFDEKEIKKKSQKVKSECLNIVLPEPGGPIISTLWFPAAAMVSARFTCS